MINEIALTDKKVNLKAVDFFCGVGGMTHGLLKAGIKVVGGIDNAVECRESYEFNNAPARFVETDIEKLSAEHLTDLLGVNADDDSLVFVGCSPCQYWSKVRANKEKSLKSAFLLKEFQRFVQALNPGFIILENVPGLKTGKNSYLPGFLKFLSESGYAYVDSVVDTSCYGIPQHRERYLLIASRVHRELGLPAEDSDSVKVSGIIGEGNGFKKIPAGHRDDSDFLHTSAGLSNDNLKRIKMTPHNGGNRFSWKDTELQIPAYKGKDHCFRDVYGRIYWDRPAPTITTKFHSLSNGRFGHPEEDRALSLREGACLQTFPKTFRFINGSIAAIARQIGNAVPPLLAEKLGKHLIRICYNGDL